MALIKLKSNVMNPLGWKGNEQVEVDQSQAENWAAKGWCEILKGDVVEKPVIEPIIEQVMKSKKGVK